MPRITRRCRSAVAAGDDKGALLTIAHFQWSLSVLHISSCKGIQICHQSACFSFPNCSRDPASSSPSLIQIPPHSVTSSSPSQWQRLSRLILHFLHIHTSRTAIRLSLQLSLFPRFYSDSATQTRIIVTREGREFDARQHHSGRCTQCWGTSAHVFPYDILHRLFTELGSTFPEPGGCCSLGSSGASVQPPRPLLLSRLACLL